jgi:hypothetical protein
MKELVKNRWFYGRLFYFISKKKWELWLYTRIEFLIFLEPWLWILRTLVKWHAPILSVSGKALGLRALSKEGCPWRLIEFGLDFTRRKDLSEIQWRNRGGVHYKIRNALPSPHEKICFIRLPPYTLQNFWQVIAYGRTAWVQALPWFEICARVR